MNVFNFSDILVVGKVSSLVRLRKGGEGVKNKHCTFSSSSIMVVFSFLFFLENEIFGCAAGLSFALSRLAFTLSLDEL